MPNQLEVLTGFHSATGKRSRNEDYGAACLGTTKQRGRHGVVAAIADGVGGAKGGRVAAELAVEGLIDGYYGLSETIGVQRAAAQAIEAVNHWIFAQGRTDPALEGMACTLTALILRGRQAHVVHIGDTRLYRLRDGRLTRLTTDHTFSRPDTKHILHRAVGAEDGIRVDYVVDTASMNDRFLLCSDGVHGTLRDRQIGDLLGRHATAEEAAGALVEAALLHGSQDNATALVVDVVTLPILEHAELEDIIAALPILGPPHTGEVVDEYALGEILSDGRYSCLFKAIDQADQRMVAIKFPKPRVAEELTFRLAFLRETWVPSRVRSPWVGEVIEPASDRQTRLYSVMPYYGGETLEQRLARKPAISVGDGLHVATRLAKAVAALHRAGIIHRDIKPDNVILESEGGLRLIDLGVVYLAHMEDFPIADIPGTPSYMAPELFDGQRADERSDLFALGVSIYRMFTGGAYPYGEVEPFSRPRFGKVVSLLRYRSDLPLWLDAVIAKAVAVAPGDRFADVVELAFELEHGMARNRIAPPRHRPLYARNPVRFWQVISAILLMLLAIAMSYR